MSKCPSCGAPRPNFHPCHGFEGEVEVCTDDYHLIDVPENLPEFKDAVLAKRAAQSNGPKHPSGTGAE